MMLLWIQLLKKKAIPEAYMEYDVFTYLIWHLKRVDMTDDLVYWVVGMI